METSRTPLSDNTLSFKGMLVMKLSLALEISEAWPSIGAVALRRDARLLLPKNEWPTAESGGVPS
jgi:hypothetical protein